MMLQIKTVTSVLKVATFISTSIPLHLIRLFVLQVTSVSTAKLTSFYMYK